MLDAVLGPVQIFHNVDALARQVSVEAPQVIGALAGLLLIAGLWTPVAGVVAGCAEAWIAFSLPAHSWSCAVLAVFAVTLALLGPGAWSIDARLYGRKHYAPPEL